MTQDEKGAVEPPPEDDGRSGGPPSLLEAKAVDVVLAEYNALRAEIVSRSSAQAALVGVGLTALGVVVGLVVQKGADQRLLLALPPLALLVNLLWSVENRRVAFAGRHIREVTSRTLKDLTGLKQMTWEEAVQRRREGLWVIPSLLADGALLALFAAAGWAGLHVAGHLASPELRTLDWVMFGASIGIPVVFALLNAIGR